MAAAERVKAEVLGFLEAGGHTKRPLIVNVVAAHTVKYSEQIGSPTYAVTPMRITSYHYGHMSLVYVTGGNVIERYATVDAKRDVVLASTEWTNLPKAEQKPKTAAAVVTPELPKKKDGTLTIFQ